MTGDKMRKRLNMKQSRSHLLLLVFDLGSLDKTSTRRASNSLVYKRIKWFELQLQSPSFISRFSLGSRAKSEEALAILSLSSL